MAGIVLYKGAVVLREPYVILRGYHNYQTLPIKSNHPSDDAALDFLFNGNGRAIHLLYKKKKKSKQKESKAVRTDFKA